MNEFYVVLPSNNATSNSNTPSKYITTFDTPIYLDSLSQWEVGLIEINFKNSIKTIQDDYAIMTKKIVGTSTLPKEIIKSEFSRHNFEFLWHFSSSHVKNSFKSPAGGWWCVEVLESENIIFPKDGKHKEYFSLTFINEKVVLTNLSEYKITLTIPKFLAIMFGFEKLTGTPKNPLIYDDLEKETVTLKSINPNEKLESPDKLIINKYKDIPGRRFVLIHSKNENAVHYSLKFEQYTGNVVRKLELQPGTYINAKQLEDELNKDSDIKSSFTFKYDDKLNRFDLITQHANAELKMYKGLNDVLGFKNSEFSFNQKPYKSEMEVNLMRGINSLFLYCDCCEFIRVGNTQAPLLRSIAFNSKIYGEMIHVNYINPIYIKVNKTFIDKIELMLCDAAGDLVPFAEGLTVVVLHFKRV